MKRFNLYFTVSSCFKEGLPKVEKGQTSLKSEYYTFYMSTPTPAPTTSVANGCYQQTHRKCFFVYQNYISDYQILLWKIPKQTLPLPVMLHYHGVHLDITIIKAFTCAESFELLLKHMIFASKNVSWVKKSRKTECILNIRHLLRRNGFKMKLQIIKIKRGLHTMYIFYCHQLFTEKGSMSFRASNRVVFFWGPAHSKHCATLVWKNLF